MPVDPPTQGRDAPNPQLKAWDAVQNNVRRYDESVIKDIADDINTLLTFAGLFSAALTAFLLPTIAQLQTDNSRTSVQLLSLLVLRDDPPPDTMPFLNSNVAALADSASFQAPGSSVAVSSLWFLSLILSLSSALLGIVAKQWCREYMKWHSVLAQAQENMILRQMRYESWEEWNVKSLILIIPAFLQLSLILFFVGLVIYSWALQIAVFAVVVSAVILVLLATALLTVLPAFRRRCPYKSPMGWVFTRFFSSMRQRLDLLQRAQDKFHILKAFGSKDPKFRVDVEALRDWRTWEMRIALDPNLCEQPGLLANRTSYDQEDADATTDAYRLTVLIRALSWVRRICSDETLRQDVDGCIHTVHAIMRTSLTSKVHLDVTVYVMRQIMGWKVGCDVVDECVQAQLATSIGTDERNKSREVARFSPKPHNRWREQAGPYLTDAAPPSTRTDAAIFLVARQSLAFRLPFYAEQWVEALQNTRPADRSRWASRVTYILAVLRYIPRDYLAVAVADGGVDIDMLAAAFTATHRRLAPHTAAYCDGLVPMVLELLRLTGDVDLSNVMTECRVSPWHSMSWICELNCNIDRMEKNLQQIYAVSQQREEDEASEHRHLLVTAAGSAIDTLGCQMVQWQSEDVLAPATKGSLSDWARAIPVPRERTPPSSAGRVLRMLTSFVTACTVSKIRNCGSYTELTWLSSLVAIYQRAEKLNMPLRGVHFTRDMEMQRALVQFLTALRDCGRQDLIDGTAIWTDFSELLRRVHGKGIERHIDSELASLRVDVVALEEQAWERKIVRLVPPGRYVRDMSDPADRSATADSVATLPPRHARPLEYRVELLQKLYELCEFQYEIESDNRNAFFAICHPLWALNDKTRVPEFSALLQRMMKALSPASLAPVTEENHGAAPTAEGSS